MATFHRSIGHDHALNAGHQLQGHWLRTVLQEAVYVWLLWKCRSRLAAASTSHVSTANASRKLTITTAFAASATLPSNFVLGYQMLFKLEAVSRRCDQIRLASRLCLLKASGTNALPDVLFQAPVDAPSLACPGSLGGLHLSPGHGAWSTSRMLKEP